MDFLKTTKYKVKHPILKQFIKYYWAIESDETIMVNHKLLPVCNIDFVLNFSTPIKYTSADKKETVQKGFHFNGLRNQYCMINQTGKLNVLGISFFSVGLYPFLKTPISEFSNKSIELDMLSHGFISELEEKLRDTDSIAEKIEIMEKELVKLIDFELIPENAFNSIFNAFAAEENPMNVYGFCEKYGINQRKLERLFNLYIGTSPGAFYRLNRFQCILNQIMDRRYVNLTLLAHDNAYYDQTHFIKEFRTFTGCSPTQFLYEKRSVKQMLK